MIIKSTSDYKGVDFFFTQIIRSCDLARTCLRELQKIRPQIGTLGKSVVDREPQKKI